MIDTILTVVYILVAVAMVVLILLQRGAGAQAGSGFGAGASGTVFGARGSANFLTKSTKWLAFVFFAVALFMAWKAVNLNKPEAEAADIGVMSSLPAVPESGASPAATVPAPGAVPAVPATTDAPQAAPAAPQPEKK
ncbi:preprotein translocase subunit SecG [Arenimonas sp. GDDSR-1]|uniref:preprotein translocase subunit SecG n=1 Tax=Arenimonas sp. GDDSR-1 TaxID=2950125 RepID=UPI00261A646E|nr:preprotein translocase subunit SecG [Arenimonas sp. GDDSR-1]